MTHKSRAGVFLLLLCLVYVLIGIPPVSAETEYIRSENAVDIQQESPSSAFSINHIGVFKPGDTIKGTILGPDDSYIIKLFNSSGDSITSGKSVSGDFTLNPEKKLSPGSYLINVDNTPFDSAAPIVVSGYDISLNEEYIINSDKVELNTTVTETASNEPPNTVEAIVWNNEEERRVQLDQTSSSESSAEYDGTVSLSGFKEGEYGIYIIATGDKKYQGENEILGINEVVDGRPNFSLPDGSTDSVSDINQETKDKDLIEPNIETNQTRISENKSTGDSVAADKTPLPLTVPVISILFTSIIAVYRSNE